MIVDFYKNLFCTSQVDWEEVLENVSTSITQDQNVRLL